MASAARSLATTNSRHMICIYSPEDQVLGDKKIALKKNHDWKVEAEGGVKDYHTYGQAFLRFLNSAEGLFRVGQLGERLPKFINATREHYGLDRLVPLDNCMSKSLLSWTWLTTIPHAITMTPGMVSDVKDAAGAWNDSSISSKQKQYKFEKATREVTDTAAMYSYSLANVVSVFPSLSHHVRSLIQFGDAATLVHDVTSLKINAQNLVHAYSVDTSKATRAMKETVEGTKRYSLVALAKDVAASVSGFFGIFTGTTILPVVAFAFLSLASTVCAVFRKMCEDTMPYKPIHFLDNRHVTQVTV